MINDDDQGSSKLLLAGYVPAFTAGFALPCYATRPRANTWYVATCSVDGDHEGTISGFETFDFDDVRLLPEELQRKVGIGDFWQDVFLWKEKTYVGLPATILQELDAELGNIEAEAPISLLDLALSAAHCDIQSLVGVAFEHISQRHGKEVADTWFRDVLIRERAKLITRRHLFGTGLAEKFLSDVRHISILELTRKFRLVLPTSIVSALRSIGQFESLKDHINAFAALVGTDIDIQSTDKVAGGDTTSIADPKEIIGETPFHTASDILIIVSGPRAGTIARHLAAPDWVPIADHSSLAFPRYLLRRHDQAGRNRGGAAVGRAVIDVVSDQTLPSNFDAYGVVVWLVDDEILLNGRADPLRYELEERILRTGDTLLLIAPALPTFEPSRILSEPKRKRSLDMPLACVIDTSLARSPFWTGNARRAVDRRIGDIITGSAMICALDERLRGELNHTRSKHDVRLLSFALERNGFGEVDSELGLLSESSLTGLNLSQEFRFTERYSRFGVRPFAKSIDSAQSGYYSIRRRDPDFQSFVFSVMASFRGLKFSDETRSRAPVHRSELLNTMWAVQSDRRVPQEVEHALVLPHLAVAARSSERTPGNGVIVTAEAPTIAAVHAAFHAGWAIARYTDRETLWETFDTKPWSSHSALPREIRLPKLQRLSRNRGLAIRGVDPRDIIRLPLEAFENWQSKAERSPLVTEARKYRASIDERGSNEIAIPVVAIQDALSSDDPAARALVQILEADFYSINGGPRKRPADLRAAWSRPSRGAKRFALEDGRLPVSLIELSPNVVPAQRLFFIDGDGSVPALFTSRLFEVWARVTLSRSTSWASRFSVSNTFETLPIPKGFAVLNEESETAQLRLARDTGRLATLIKELERDARILGRRLRTDWSSDLTGTWVGHPLLEEIDAALLSMIDLPVSASELDILDRLLTVNQEG